MLASSGLILLSLDVEELNLACIHILKDQTADIVVDLLECNDFVVSIKTQKLKFTFFEFLLNN